MKCKFLSAAAVATAMCLASPAFACKGKNVLFEDNFADDSNWGDISEVASIEGGVLKLTAHKPNGSRLLYQGDSYDKADICVDVTELTPGDTGAGLIFAAADYSSYYLLWMNPAGIAGVLRVNNKKWLSPVPARTVPSSGQKFTLRVTLNGARATAYVNNRKIADLKVNVPEGGGFIGMQGDSTDKEDVTWGFSNLKVTDLP